LLQGCTPYLSSSTVPADRDLKKSKQFHFFPSTLFPSYNIITDPSFDHRTMNNDHSNKTIYTAVPLLPPRNEEDEEEPTSRATGDDSSSPSSTSSTSSTQVAQHNMAKLFLFGVLFGLACFCSFLDSHWIPTFSLENQNVSSHSLAAAKILLWPAFAVAMAYGTFWTIWRCLERPSVQMQNADFLEHCIFYNMLEVALGFGVACTISGIIVGNPFIGVMSIILVMAIWTLIMYKVAHPSAIILQDKRVGTVLPMVVV
jgi:hypothetical protein